MICRYDGVAGMLIVMSGLPGAGKSSIAQELGRLPPAPVLSVDPVEAAMWRAGIGRGQPTGPAAYVVVEALASDVLALGQTVIVDAVNDAREQWRGLARRRSVVLRHIEVTCSDHALHRRRLEGRRRDIDGFAEPTWASVEARRANFGSWREDLLVLDSAAPLTGNVRIAMAHLRDTRGDPSPSPSE